MLRVVVALLCVTALRAAQKCQPDANGVLRFQGMSCASTTRYDDTFRGACGCGPPDGDVPFNWNLQELLTAPSQNYFDDGGNATWCGSNCGKCVKLTPTGGYVPGQGEAPPSRAPQIFLVTDLCPREGNQEWCGIMGQLGSNNANNHGYEVHFDLQNHAGQINSMGWDNPEVTWEVVDCPNNFFDQYSTCECPRH